MMKNFLKYTALFVFCFIPFYAEAASNEQLIPISSTTKYYKTIVVPQQNVVTMIDNNFFYTEEITKEEYERTDVNQQNASTIVETEYKKLTTTILKGSNYFRYQVTLDWKKVPKTRSYDTIAIGHYVSVKIIGMPDFSQTFCETEGICYTTQNYYPQIFQSGASVTFSLPLGEISTLSQKMYIDVMKTDSTSTIVKQLAAGDYAHATKTISASKSRDFTVNTTGIHFSSLSTGYYDEIGVAEVIWNGNW